MKIAFVEMKDAWEKEFVKKKMTDQEAAFFDEPAQDRINDLREAHVLSIFVNSRIDKKYMALLPNLKCIATRSTGFDHIDLAAAKERGIAVCNVPTYGENTVAEHTFALILSLSRNLRKAYLRTVQNDFSIDGLMGFDLKGKTLGVVGTGHIGLHVIRMALGFGMKVIAYDVKQQNFLSEILSFEYVSFEELLKRSDIISFHAPYLPSTRHLINKKNIELIKKGAVLVNTARGGLIETGALVEALDKKILSGVGLDVLEEEELKNHVLLHRENVIYTPHMAFYSCEAVQRILDTTMDNIRAFIEGNPVNRVG